MQIRRISNIGATYRNLRRYERIMAVLFSYGFDELLDRLGIDRSLQRILQRFTRWRRKNTSDDLQTLQSHVRLRMAFEELGSTFVKIGQILSTRTDILPEEYTKELSKLQSQVKPFPFEEAEAIIEEELGGPLSDFFSQVNPKPIGAASLGQVHEATLLTGESVVIKVQRPGIDKTVEADLEILLYMTGLAERTIDEAAELRPVEVVKEFARALSKELDYKVEEASILRFNNRFSYDSAIHKLKLYPKLSTHKILVMEKVDGFKADADLDELHAAGIDTKAIARKGADCVLRQIFVHGFFHGDPHPGNIIITPKGKIAFIDFGMTGRLNQDTRIKVTEMMLALSQRDEVRCTRLLLRLCDHNEDVDINLLERDVADLMDQHLDRVLEDVEFAEILRSLTATLTRHQLFLPSELSMVIKAIISLEGLGKKLYPEIDLMKQIYPVITKAYLDRYDPRYLGKSFLSGSRQVAEVVRDLPEGIIDLVEKARHGKLTNNTRVSGSPAFYSFTDHLVKRVSYSLVLAALIMGSALMVLADIPPKWSGIPLIGMIGFVASATLAFLYLLRD